MSGGAGGEIDNGGGGWGDGGFHDESAVGCGIDEEQSAQESEKFAQKTDPKIGYLI